MTFQYQKSRKVIEVLNDLVSIQNDRIAGYQQALGRLINIDSDLHEEFENIILDSYQFRQELLQKLKELNGSSKTYTPILGKIYRAWMDLKITFSGNSQKAIIGWCHYNEEIALHAYKAALNISEEMPQAIRQLIEKQEVELKKIYDQVQTYREIRHVVDYRVLYLA